MRNVNHSLLIVVRGNQREVVTRPGHIDIKTAMGLAASAGGTLHVLRHHRSLPEPGQIEVVRIHAAETV